MEKDPQSNFLFEEIYQPKSEVSTIETLGDQEAKLVEVGGNSAEKATQFTGVLEEVFFYE